MHSARQPPADRRRPQRRRKPAERPRVSLREIDADNVRAVCELDVAPTQQTHVARNALTVAESAYDQNAWLRGIYAGDEPVGLLALVADTEKPDYWLARLMIAGQHQGRGYGRDAMALLVAARARASRSARASDQLRSR